MEAGSSDSCTLPSGAPPPAALAPAPPPPEPCTPAELRALVHGGENDSDACERVLAQVARVEAALDLEIGDGLAAMTAGTRLIRRGFSNLGDYARATLDLQPRTAQAMARLSRELRSRPLLRAAVRAGEVRLRNAQTVLSVAIGEAEAEWTERARTETVRALEKAVRAARAGGEEEDEWTRLRLLLSPEDRATVDEALAIAGKVVPGSRRPERLEAMAQEYLAEHAVEAGDDGAGAAGASFRPESDRLERQKAQLEAETEGWSYLPPPASIPAPDAGFEHMTSAEEIDAALKDLAARRRSWDAILGYCAYVVRRSGLWKTAAFASFEHYCEQRLGLSARAVEQRAALEKRLWESPALRAARDGGLSYEKVRLLSHLPEREIAAWTPRARSLTCVALEEQLEARDEAQMRAARTLRARVPVRVALLLQAAFRAVRATEGCLLHDGACLVRVARHFTETWRSHAKKAQTLSQKVRKRDLGRCQAPGCSRRAVHAHHVNPRSHGGSDDEENLVSLCACHHLLGIHGGFMRVRGRAPDGLVWEVAGRVWRGGDLGAGAPALDA